MRPARPAQSDLPRMLAPVILGSDFCCYSYIRCFWEAYGVKPIVLASADIKSVRSRFCDYRVIPGIDRPEVCLPELERLGDELIAAGKIPFLVGCGDHYARLVSENKPQIEERWYTPYLDFELLDDITQKERFYEICEEIGVPYPKTVYLDCGDKTATVDDGGFMYPVIAKPSNSAAWHYAEFEGQQKVYLIHSREQLEALYKQLQETTYDKLLIVQEFIPGDDTQIRILSSYLDAAGDPVFMVGGRVMVEDHSPTAIGNPAVIVSEQLDAVSDDALRFMRHVGYRGMANFDVKYDERDGTYKFFEINTRPGRSSDFVRQAGINFAQVQHQALHLHHGPSLCGQALHRRRCDSQAGPRWLPHRAHPLRSRLGRGLHGSALLVEGDLLPPDRQVPQVLLGRRCQELGVTPSVQQPSGPIA